MKTIKRNCILLAAISAIGINVNAATLQEALSSGKFNGELRSTIASSSSVSPSVMGEAAIHNNTKSGAIGLQLNYETADYKGFKAEVGFQVARDLELHDRDFTITNTGPDFASEDDPRSSADGSNMYLSNISYSFDKSEIKVGKQTIMTPLIANAHGFTLVDSFNALALRSDALKETNVQFYAIKDWYQLYHADSAFGNTRAIHYEKPIYSLFLENKSIKDLTLTAQYMATNSRNVANHDEPNPQTDSYSVSFTEFDYKFPALHMGIGAFHSGVKFDATGQDDTSMFGLKLGGGTPFFAYKLGYTSVSDDNSHPGTLGHIPLFFKYNGAQMFSDNFFAGMTSKSLLIIPHAKILGFESLLSYSKYGQSNKGKTNSGHDLDGASEVQVDFTYDFGNGFSSRLQLAFIDYDMQNASDHKLTTSRLHLSYKF